MALITFIDHDGTEHKVVVEEGYSLMQAAIDNMLEGVIAECGGACSCATCHCYIDNGWVDKVGQPEVVEQEMLDFALDRKDTSRLSCQIQVTEELDGLVVRLPKSQC